MGEKVFNFDNKESTIKSVFIIVSFVSWAMFIITGWISFKWLKDDRIVWTIYRMKAINLGSMNSSGLLQGFQGLSSISSLIILNLFGQGYPIQMHEAILYIIIVLLMICALAGCIIYVIFTFKKNPEIEKGMHGEWSKFHFIPLFCVSALFIIGECFDKNNPKLKDMQAASLVFSILGLASLIFIYFMTEQNGDWYIKYTLKNGTYAILIILMWYNFCYVIFGIRVCDKPTSTDLDKWLKGCSIAFSIIFGVGALIFSYFGTDIVAAATTLLIYIGMTAYFFDVPKVYRGDKTAGGVIDIIMCLLSAACIGYLVYKKVKTPSAAAL